MCFRDYKGSFLLGKSDFFYSSAMVLEVKSLGLLDTIQVAIWNKMHDLLLESDSKVLSDALA